MRDSRPLSDVREAVQREWLAGRRKEILDSTCRKLREKYAIVVEAPIRQSDSASPSGRVAAVQGR
jgi:hypothetical protein